MCSSSTNQQWCACSNGAPARLPQPSQPRPGPAGLTKGGDAQRGGHAQQGQRRRNARVGQHGQRQHGAQESGGLDTLAHPQHRHAAPHLRGGGQAPRGRLSAERLQPRSPSRRRTPRSAASRQGTCSTGPVWAGKQ